VHADPVNGIDPSGNMSVGMAIGIGIGISLGSMSVGATLGAIYGKDSVIGSFGLGILQGFANIINGIQDIVIGIINLGIASQNVQWYFLSGSYFSALIPYISSPDWSRGIFTEEESNLFGLGDYWGDSHGWSKFIGSDSAIVIIGGIGSKIVKLLAKKPKTPSSIRELERHSNALKTDSHHAFPDIVDNYAEVGEKFSIPRRGEGGVIIGEDTLYQVEGSLNGKVGIFEWIVDNIGVSHRRFIPNGKITGKPNQVPH
jgi:hypothetical protein